MRRAGPLDRASRAVPLQEPTQGRFVDVLLLRLLVAAALVALVPLDPLPHLSQLRVRPAERSARLLVIRCRRAARVDRALVLLPEQRLAPALCALPESPALALGRRDATADQPVVLLASRGFMPRGCSEQHLTSPCLLDLGIPFGLGLRRQAGLLGFMRPLTQLLERIEGRSYRHPLSVTENRRPDDSRRASVSDANGAAGGSKPSGRVSVERCVRPLVSRRRARLLSVPARSANAGSGCSPPPRHRGWPARNARRGRPRDTPDRARPRASCAARPPGRGPWHRCLLR
jgi:hypothetical protein